MNNTKERANQYFKDSLGKQESNLDDALALIQKAIELAPEVSMYWSTKAQYLYEQGKYKDALITVEKAIQLKPTNYFAWSGKGLIKRNMGEYKQAAEAYIESLKIEPDFNIYTLLSSVQLEFDLKAAIQSAKKALELNPDWEEAKNILKEAEDKIKNGNAEK